jgi:hypothetical protein
VKFHTIPILRIFDESKAPEFYLDFPGMSVDWEHRFEPDTPIYIQAPRGELVFYLSEYSGDGTPGTTIFINIDELDQFHSALHQKDLNIIVQE